MTRIVELCRFDSQEVEGFSFKKGVPVSVEDDLAAKLLGTGAFADVSELAPKRDAEGNVIASRHQACGILDYSTIHIDKHDKARLIPHVDPETEEKILRPMIFNWSNPVLDVCPGLRYWEMDDTRYMYRSDNNTGHQQRAFDFYWAIRTLLSGGITLGVGSTPCAGPGCLGTDKYIAGESPHEGRYGIYHSNPHMRMDAEQIFPFIDGMFQCVQANHVIEHFERPWAVIKEMFRVLEPDGYLCMITPDMAYNDRPCEKRGYKGIDPTHRYEFSVDQFHEELLDYTDKGWFPPYEIVSLNTLDNSFSFEIVLQKRHVST